MCSRCSLVTSHLTHLCQLPFVAVSAKQALPIGKVWRIRVSIHMAEENIKRRNKRMEVRKTWSRKRKRTVLPDLPVHVGALPAHSWLLKKIGRGPKGHCPPSGWYGHLHCHLHDHCGEIKKETQVQEKEKGQIMETQTLLFSYLSYTSLVRGSHQPIASQLT